MKAYVKIVLFVVFFIAVSAIFAALYYYHLGHADLSSAKPDYTVTAVQLQKEFEIDEAAASSKYINKIVEVTGTISSIETSGNVVTINIKTDNDVSSVICTLSGSVPVAELKTGDEVTVRGECSGFLMDVLLNNCNIVR